MKAKIIFILMILPVLMAIICCLACNNTSTDTSTDTSTTLHKVTYTTDGNGIIEGETIQELKSGEQSSTVTAVPNEGYVFVKWSDENTDATRTDIIKNSNLKFTAIFDKCKYTVKYNAMGGGVIYGDDNQTVEYGGNTTTVTATPLMGYRFIRWLDNGSTRAQRSDKNVSSDITATAIFEVIRTDIQFINYLTDGNGTIEGRTLQQVVYDEPAEAVTAIPNEGYEFEQWSDGVTDCKASRFAR